MVKERFTDKQIKAFAPVSFWLLVFLCSIIATVLIYAMNASGGFSLASTRGVVVQVLLIALVLGSLAKLIQTFLRFTKEPGCSVRELWELFGER